MMGSILECPTRSSSTELMKSDSPIHVLVVEDEFLNRLHAVNLVEDAGYKAIGLSLEQGPVGHVG